MNGETGIIAIILISLLMARSVGTLLRRFHFPAAAGEIVAGMAMAALFPLLVPMSDIFERQYFQEVLSVVSDVGVFLLMLYAGVEMNKREIVDSSKQAILIAFGGIALPFTGGLLVAFAFLPEAPLTNMQALVTGVVLSVTAIPAVIKILSDLGVLHSRAGKMIVSAALADDIIGLLMLAGLLAIINTGSVPTLSYFLVLITKISLFFVIVSLIGHHIFPHIIRSLSVQNATTLEFSALFATALAYGWLSELMEMHWIIGVFLAGLFFDRCRAGKAPYILVKSTLKTLVGGVAGPLFFFWVGLHVSPTLIGDAPAFTLALIGIAFLSKMVGAGVPARLIGFSSHEAATIGAGMCARGAVELIILGIALEAGVFGSSDDPVGQHLFSALILVGIITTAMTPVILTLLSKGVPQRSP